MEDTAKGRLIASLILQILNEEPTGEMTNRELYAQLRKKGYEIDGDPDDPDTVVRLTTKGKQVDQN